MKKKRWIAGLIAAMMLTVMLPLCPASAAEISIFDWKFQNEYADDSIATNWWGQAMTECPGYKEGEKWATAWGGEGWYYDAEDGSLAITANPGSSNGAESYLGRRVVTEAIPDHSEITITYKFRTASKPTKSQGEVWIKISSQEEGKTGDTEANSFMIKNSMTEDMSHGFASTTAWPFTAKTPDRDPNAVSFTYDKDYEVAITLKPNTDMSSRYVAKIKEDGKDKGTVIVNEWPGFKRSQFKRPVQITIAAINRSDILEQEPIIYMKEISMTAKLPNEPLGVSYYPENGSRNVALDTACYAEFEKAVEAVDASQVSITGGAEVTDVSMDKDNRRVVLGLSGLAPKQSYTVTIRNVKGKVADEAFDYTWSFTTDSGLIFSKPYYSQMDERVSVKNEGDLLISAVDTADAAYLNGGAWGSGNLDDRGMLKSGANLDSIADEFKVEDGYLWAYQHNQGNATEDRAVSKHFAPIQKGDTLNLSATMRFNYANTDYNLYLAGSSLELTGDNGNLTLIQYDMRSSIYWNRTKLRFLNNGGANFYENETANTEVTTVGNREGKLGHTDGYDWKVVDGNDMFTSWLAVNYMNLFANSPNSISANGGDLTINLTAAPSGSNPDQYEVTMTTVGPYIDVTSRRTVSADLITGLSDFCMVSSRSKNGNQFPNPEKVIGIKDLSISVQTGATAPTVGETKVYMNYENIAETAADADVLVLEKDAVTDRVLGVHVEKLHDLTGSGVITIPVTMTKEGSKLAVYVMNGADGMVLLAEPASATVLAR